MTEKPLQVDEPLYCERCKESTRHFPTASLHLPCCSKCMGLNDRIIVRGALSPDEERLLAFYGQNTALHNALIESIIRRTYPDADR